MRTSLDYKVLLTADFLSNTAVGIESLEAAGSSIHHFKFIARRSHRTELAKPPPSILVFLTLNAHFVAIFLVPKLNYYAVLRDVAQAYIAPHLQLQKWGPEPR